MKLTNLTARNFRSIEQLELSNLDRVNVFVGRNNVGKSSIMDLIGAVGQAASGGRQFGRVPTWPAALPNRDQNLRTEVEVMFSLGESEIDLLIQAVRQTSMPPLDERLKALRDSAFARNIRLSLVSPSDGSSFVIRKVELRSETLENEDDWILLQEGKDITPFIPALRELLPYGVRIDSRSAGLGQGSSINYPNEFPTANTMQELAQLPGGQFGIGLIKQYFSSAYFAGTVRSTAGEGPIEQADFLDPSGFNLHQVLNTLNQNKQQAFEQIRQLMYAAVPELGQLRSPLISTATRISILNEETNTDLYLREVGSGVEQLLMLFAILVAAPIPPVILIEEPETHLHPAAQRFLLDTLSEKAHQCFFTTHSPALMPASSDSRIYRIQLQNKRTVAELVEHPDSLGETLRDIGARNSDVLLSDRVLFVEGPSDEDVIRTFATTLDRDFDRFAVSTITTDGGSHAVRHAPLRSKLLEDISLYSQGIPHWFLVDRDERSDDELERLKAKLQNHMIVLERREIENYLLEPSAILRAVAKRHESNKPLVTRLEELDPEEVRRWIVEEATSLKNLSVCKRIRWRIPGFRDGLLPRDMVSSLFEYAYSDELKSKIEEVILQTTESVKNDLQLDIIIQEERERANDEWATEDGALRNAPGHEVLAGVFSRFTIQAEHKVKYDKVKDCAIIAAEFAIEDIPDELRQVINMVTQDGI